MTSMQKPGLPPATQWSCYAMAGMLCASLIVAVATPRTALGAGDAQPDLPTMWVAQKEASRAEAAKAKSNSAPEWGAQKSYAIPALEIIGFDVLLNQFDRHYFGCCEFHSNLQTIRRNFRGPWVVDSDGFTVNQLGL